MIIFLKCSDVYLHNLFHPDGCYGSINSSPSKTCCGGSNECGGAKDGQPGTSRNVDIEDLVLPGKR